MPRASGLIHLAIVGSVMTLWACAMSRHTHGYYDSAGYWHPTTQPYTGSGGSGGYFYHGVHYYGTPGYSGYSGGGAYSRGGFSSSSSGVSHGGFGATGHSAGGHA